MAHTKKSIDGDVNNGTANTFSYSGSFDVFKASEVEVELDNIALTFTTGTINESANPREYTVDFTNKTVHIGGADLASTNAVVIQPVTDMGAPTPRATYTPGASVTSTDLNNNQLQLMRKAMEYNEQKLSSRGGTMTGNLHMGENVDISFEGSTDNTNETTITVADPTADRTITFPDTTGTVVTTGDTGTVSRTMIANDAINGDKIANDVINSEHYVSSSIDTEHYASGSVDATALGSSAVTTAKINNLAVTTGKIADDAVTAAKLAHTSVTPGTYSATDLSVDAQGRITAASSGTIAGSEIAADAIDGTKIADDSINSEHYVNLSIDTDHIADAQITQPKLAANAVATANILNNQVSESKIIDGAVTNNKLGADAVNGSKIADDSIDSEHYVDGSIDSAHIGGSQVIAAKLASNSVTESKITDANVTTIKIADANVTLGKLHGDLKQTSISDSDTQLPTSGAVVDYVAAQLLPFGGFEAVATEVAFPNTQPASGVIISISDAAGVVVNGSGTSTTGRTVGGSTVTINNFPSSLNSETLASGVGLMVSSTGSSQIYNYHKILAAETDVKQLSDDINDFNARYRVGSSNPTSALDGGDLFFNTSTSKLLVYNNTNSAWEEAQSIGNFFISTFSEAFDGSRTQFTLSNAPANVQQILLSLNGVVQKPGTAFTLSGSTVTLASAPASGTDYFAVVMGSTVNIGTPSDNTVDADVLTSGAVTTVKIADGAVTTAKIADANVTEAKIANDAVTAAKLADTSVSAGSYGSSTSIPSITVDAQGRITAASGNTVNTDLVGDTSPQLGGNLASNGNEIVMADNDKIKLGTDADLQLYHTGTVSRIQDEGTGGLEITSNGTGVDINKGTSEYMGRFLTDGAVELYHNNVKRLETHTEGITSYGHSLFITGDEGESAQLLLYADDGDDNADRWKILASAGGPFYLQNYTSGSWESNIIAYGNGQVELYYDHSKKFETLTDGVKVSGDLTVNNANKLYLENDSENKTSYLYNSAASTHANITFYTAETGGTAGNRWQITKSGNFIPTTNNTYDIGDTSNRVRNIYTNDLHLSNKGHTNDVDGSWGDWTIQEGESDLFLKNNRSGKKYKFNLTEVS